MYICFSWFFVVVFYGIVLFLLAIVMSVLLFTDYYYHIGIFILFLHKIHFQMRTLYSVTSWLTEHWCLTSREYFRTRTTFKNIQSNYLNPFSAKTTFLSFTSRTPKRHFCLFWQTLLKECYVQKHNGDPSPIPPPGGVAVPTVVKKTFVFR